MTLIWPVPVMFFYGHMSTTPLLLPLDHRRPLRLVIFDLVRRVLVLVVLDSVPRASRFLLSCVPYSVCTVLGSVLALHPFLALDRDMGRCCVLERLLFLRWVV